MALRDQLLGLGSSVYNLAGAPLGSTAGGLLQGATGLSSLTGGNIGGISNLLQGANTLGAFGDTFSGLGGALGGLSGFLGPAAAIGSALFSGGRFGPGGIVGGMTEAANRKADLQDAMTARSRFQDIAKDPGAWLQSQPSQFQDIDKAALSGKLTVPNFENMLLGPENQTPELKEALTGLMFGGAQQGPTGPQWGEAWHPSSEAMGFPWGHTGDTGEIGPSGHMQPAIPGWPAGMISPLETDLGGTESPGRGGVTGVMGPWMNRLWSQIHNPGYSLGLSTGGPAGLLADFRRIGPEVRDEGE